jgi:asparagine synthase (glutamine-hydrolysing)
MCGIFGAITKSKDLFWAKEKVVEAFNLISHRGPDSSSYKDGIDYFLGHKRLSIIDVSENASQPFVSNDNKVTIIFNGEIYNFKELRSDLGYYDYRSQSDTEVILAGYLIEGITFFKKLRGMYAFSILDERDELNRSLILVRDPSGIKPLYYFHKNNRLVFGSEIKCIKPLLHRNEREINFEVLKYYISLGYCPDPLTIYKDINCIKAGEVFKLDLNTFISESNKFYNHFDNLPNDVNKNSINETENFLERAVKLNSVSDVPITYALSGGVDSSLIVALSKKVGLDPNTFTVSFNDSKYDESSRALKFAQKLDVKNQIIKPDLNVNLDLINKIFDNFDQPYSDTSAIPFYFLTKESRNFSKVLVGGDGGDEIHNGYPSMNWLPNLLKYKTVLKPVASLYPKFESFNLPQLREIKRVSGMLYTNSLSDMVCKWHSWIPSDSTFKGKSVFNYNPNSIYEMFESIYYDNEIYEDFHKITHSYFYKRMIGDYLRKTDMVSMLNGVEYRVPFLDEDFINNGLQIPYEKRKNKVILKKMHSKYFPGKEFDFPKSGFGIPLDKYLTKDVKEEIYQLLMNRNGVVLDLINSDYIDYLFEILKNGDNKMTSRVGVYQRIITFYSLQRWFLENND